MHLSLGQAAKETGKSKSVISNAIKTGRLSASKGDKNQWQIDPAELFRVFPPQNAKNGSEERDRTPENDLENRLLIQEIGHLKDQLGREMEISRDLSRRLDQEFEERQRLTALLTDQRSQEDKAKDKEARTGWRARLGNWIAGNKD